MSAPTVNRFALCLLLCTAPWLGCPTTSSDDDDDSVGDDDDDSSSGDDDDSQGDDDDDDSVTALPVVAGWQLDHTQWGYESTDPALWTYFAYGQFFGQAEEDLPSLGVYDQLYPATEGCTSYPTVEALNEALNALRSGRLFVRAGEPVELSAGGAVIPLSERGGSQDIYQDQISWRTAPWEGEADLFGGAGASVDLVLPGSDAPGAPAAQTVAGALTLPAAFVANAERTETGLLFLWQGSSSTPVHITVGLEDDAGYLFCTADDDGEFAIDDAAIVADDEISFSQIQRRSISEVAFEGAWLRGEGSTGYGWWNL